MAKEDAKNQIPYVPFNTFDNAIQALEHTMPPKLDKSMWPSYSGAIQSQLWSAFRFFNLVNPDGTPREMLLKLVKDKANRKTHLKSLLEEFYPSLMALELAKVTTAHFNETMKGYGLGPETQKKASSFFLQAAKAAGIPLSTFITKKTRMSGARKARKNGVKTKTASTTTPDQQQIVTPLSGAPVKSVTLENGIILSLSSSADTFRMTPADRKFVNALLEQLETYEAAHPAEEYEEEEEIGGQEEIHDEENEEVHA